MDAITLANGPGSCAGTSMNSSEELIMLARRGDEEAFRLIFERFTRPVISFIFYMVNQRELAEELAQETFIRAYRNLHTLREETKLSTWLFGIAKNVARESLRAQQKDSRNVEINSPSILDLQDNRSSPSRQLLDKELNHQISNALEALDEDKRLVFTLKIYQQLSYEEISEITGFSLPKIRNDLHRARAEMRERLSRYMGVSR